jgi:hypothetical protein
MPETGQNRREKTRVDFQAQIVVDIPASGIALDGDSRNLSLNGIFVETDETIAVHTPCTVSIYLSGTAVPRCLSAPGEVVRSEARGIAIAFDPMDIDTYTELRNIVRYNSQDPDGVY